MRLVFFLGVAEDLMAVLDDELHGIVLCVHVCHFALETGVTHDSWREDDCKIFRCHLPDASVKKLQETL